MKIGRPLGKKSRTPEDKELLQEQLKEYIEKNTIPIVKEFCYLHNIPSQKIYEMEYLSDLLKELIDKKEANLEKGALAGKINTTMAIFSLKQLGWKDKQEFSGNINYTLIEPDDLKD